MKKNCMILAVALVVFSLTGCGKKTKANGVVNLFTWQEYVPDVNISAFEKETGIKVNYTYFSTNEEMLAKLEAVNGGQYDVVICGDYIIDIMNEKGNLLKKLDVSKIPNYDSIDPVFQSKFFDPENSYTVPYAVMFPAVLYNPKETSLTFDSLSDLADPSLENNVVITDDPRANIGLALSVNGYSYNEKDSLHLSEAQAWLRTFRKNVKAFSTDDPEGFVVNGEAAVCYANASQCKAGIDRDPSLGLKIAYPSGIFSQQDNYIIPVNAPNEDNAYALINFLLSQESVRNMELNTYYQNCSKHAKSVLSEEELKNVAIAPEGLLDSVESIENVGTVTEIYDRIWTEFK
ncbi:MAG: spermidine/putrescine ABC transporter substrate-binding protein [Treponema sp.]|nr:spermidine/putrescine ABC transporter substrate-binding protein [Treponema sp.]